MSDQGPPDDAVPLEEILSDAALAAVMGDPYEVGLRVALDDGVAAVLPGVARELAWLDRVVAATEGRFAALAAAPVAVPGVEAAPVAVGEHLPDVAAIAAPLPAPPASWGGRSTAPIGEVASPTPVAAPAAAVAAAPAGAAAGRLDWGGLDWGRLASVPGVAAAPAVPEAAAAPEAAVPAPAAAWSWPEPVRAAAPMPPPGEVSAAPVARPAPEPAMPGWQGGGGALALPDTPPAPADAADAAQVQALEGRLEIDGAALGRFIAEQLGREAMRPPAGMTGFDPLVSPARMSAFVG